MISINWKNSDNDKLVRDEDQLFILEFLANIYMFTVNNRNIRRICELCLKLRKNKNVSDVVLVFLLLTLNIYYVFLVLL